MKENGGNFAAIGAVVLAVLCCAGLPLVIGAIAAVGVGGLLGGVGIAAVVALIAITALVGVRMWHRRA